MLTLKDFKAILERILANRATAEDGAALCRSLRQTDETVQLEVQQGTFVDIEQIINSDVHIVDLTINDIDTIKQALLEILRSPQSRSFYQSSRRRSREF